MVLFGNILIGLAVVVDLAITFMVFVVIASAVISWVNADPYNPIVRFLHAITEPVLRPLRRYIKPIGGVADITPLILLALLYFLRFALVPTLDSYGRMLAAYG